METTSREYQVSPLGRAVIKAHVTRLLRDFESLDHRLQRVCIEDLRDAVNCLCASAFRDAVKAGVDPTAAIGDLVAEVRDIEVDLQDLAPRADLARKVAVVLRRLATDVPIQTPYPECATSSAVNPGTHARRVAKLKAHIEATKAADGEGFSSKAAFYARLGIDSSDYYKWQAQKKPNAPGYAAIIEAAIDKLPA